MALVCQTNTFILGPAPISGFYWYWDKNNRLVSNTYFGTVSDYYTIPDGSVIGATGSYDVNQVYIFTKATPADNAFPPIDAILLQSTSGDYYNKLLSATVTDYVLTVTMWAITAKEVTTLTFPMPQVYDSESPANLRATCFTDYYLAEGTIISEYCDGYTRVTIASDGAGDVTITYDSNSVECGYIEQLEAVVFTETKRIKYERGCFKNPLFLVWKNLVGGWDSWLFQNNQIESISTESLGEFFGYYESTANITNTSSELGKNAYPSLVVNAEFLNENQKRVISKILYSNKVYIVDTDGSILQEVKVSTGSFLVAETKKSLFNIEFQIELPQINTLRN